MALDHDALVQYFRLLPHSKMGVTAYLGMVSFRVELACCLSVHLCGFSLDSLLSYHNPNTCTLITSVLSMLEAVCECMAL